MSTFTDKSDSTISVTDISDTGGISGVLSYSSSTAYESSYRYDGVYSQSYFDFSDRGAGTGSFSDETHETITVTDKTS